MRTRPESGLTLVEMLAVLFILALVAGIAVTSTEALVDQSRLDTTRRTLDNLEEAILGVPDARQPDGTPISSGFLQDIGRLPKSQADAHPDPDTALSRRLKELWEPTGLPAFSMAAIPYDPTEPTPLQIIPVGWRGPYLHLSSGSIGLRDGWGFPVVPFAEGATDFSTFPPVSSPADPASIFVSFGIDRTFQDDDLRRGRVISKSTATITPIVEARHTGEIQVTVESAGALPTASNVLVRVFGPEEGVAAVLDQDSFATTELPKTITLAPVPAGLRYVRVYLHDGPGPGTTGNVPEPVLHRGLVKPVIVTSGTTSVMVRLP